MTSPTAADYGWIRSPSSFFRYAQDYGYTMTLVRGVAPAELLALAGAEQRGACEGVGELIERNNEFTDAFDPWPDSFIAGAFTVPGDGGNWTLALEFGGDLGTRPRLLETLSAGTRAVAHSSNGGKPLDFFHWYEDGESRTVFEWPSNRSGSTPDELVPLIREVGLDPDGDGDPDVDHKAAVFALTERLTGVRVTEELLRSAPCLLGEVPEEPVEEWHGITIDLRDAQGEGPYIRIEPDQV
ncbi:DUF6461 domain-containing protein [Streptomyces sp. NPDC026673]|uniref:DUF6461 domain-containing protein n=1 Tax=Streptomyces sp. NPDC026673 TaxID=3155724 RepID=UPI0033C97C8E